MVLTDDLDIVLALWVKLKNLNPPSAHPRSPTLTHGTHGLPTDLPWRPHSKIRKIVDLAPKYVHYAKVMEAVWAWEQKCPKAIYWLKIKLVFSFSYTWLSSNFRNNFEARVELPNKVKWLESRNIVLDLREKMMLNEIYRRSWLDFIQNVPDKRLSQWYFFFFIFLKFRRKTFYYS